VFFCFRSCRSRWSRRVGLCDAGFTLTELVIAMVVLGVLSSVAIPSFLGSRNNSYDKEAQSSIDNVLKAAKFHYQSQGDFSDASSAQCGDSSALAADLQKLEPNVDVVASSVSSTNSRIVSVQAVQTWDSTGGLLGCQGFYAVAFSSSGSCWAARIILEGKFLASGSVSPVVVNAQLNTSNSAIATWSALAVNGHAFGVLKPQTSAADGDNTNGLIALKNACKAKTQSTGLATTSSNYIAPSQFYATWRETTTGGIASTSSSSSSSSATYAVGDTGPGGGVVFYVATADFTSTGSDCDTACRYLEVTTSQQSLSSPFATSASYCYAAGSDVGNMRCDENSIYSNSAGQAAKRAAAAAIGMGMANTNQIYDRLTTAGSVGTSSYAAGVAWAYSNNGKSDWYLPTRSELNQMCKWIRNQAWVSDATACDSTGALNTGRNATGFLSGTYWSSTEGGLDTAYNMYTPNGTQGNGYKYGNFNVRAVRAFG